MSQATMATETSTERNAKLLDNLYDRLASYARTQRSATFLPRLAATYAKLVASDRRAESARRDAVRDVLIGMVETHSEEVMAVESLAEAMHLLADPTARLR